MESKSEKFTRLAESRVAQVADELRKLKNCSNRNAYEYSDDQVKQIFDYLHSELRYCYESYKDPNKKQTFKFK